MSLLSVAEKPRLPAIDILTDQLTLALQSKSVSSPPPDIAGAVGRRASPALRTLNIEVRVFGDAGQHNAAEDYGAIH